MDEHCCRYVDLARDVLAGGDGVRLVGVDGCGAAGKTTFATRLSRAAGGAPIVHTDDFASWDEPIEWWPRMLADVIEPLTSGLPASFRPYDWVRREPAATPITVPPAPLVVIEGVGATRQAWRDRLAAAVWIEVAAPERLRRGVDRDGEHMREFWGWWMAAEDRYVADEQPARHADLLVDGDPDVAHDPETEFVVLRRPEAGKR